jgi:hypothetical protein
MFTLVPLLRHEQDNAGTTAPTAVFGQWRLATGEWRPIGRRRVRTGEKPAWLPGGLLGSDSVSGRRQRHCIGWFLWCGTGSGQSLVNLLWCLILFGFAASWASFANAFGHEDLLWSLF